MKAAVLGTGAWGTALAQVLADNGHTVYMWGIEPSQVSDIRDRHTNTAYFEDLELPRNITATEDIKEAVEDAALMVVAVPTFAVRETVRKAAPYINRGVLPISVAKGFDPQTGGFVSDAIRESLSGYMAREVVTLAGPSFAVEVVRRLPTAVVAASPSPESSILCQRAFSCSYFRVYTNDDEVGAELCGAIKNVIALASGCLEGMGYRTNTRSALITRGLAEMGRFVISQGGQYSTVYGLTGLGDLVLTCSSSESRNYQLGKKIGEAGRAEQVLKENKTTAEGVKACELLIQRARKAKVEMPICESIYKVLYEGADLKSVMEDLMSRPLRSEED